MQLSDFKTYVKQDFKRTDKDTELVQAYNDAIVAVSLTMPHGAYKYQSYLPLVAKQEDYPLPSTIIHLIHPVRILEGSATGDEGYSLNHLTKQQYDEKYPNPNRTDPSQGTLADYCIYSGSILVGPTPETGTNDLIEIDWTKRPTALSADADTPALGSEWDEVLKQMVLFRIYRGLELYEEASYWRSQFEDNQGDPVGLFKRLLDIEDEKEGCQFGQVSVNDL